MNEWPSHAFADVSSSQLKQGKIGSGSYVPNGLTADQYQKIRDQESAKKEANYQRNVAKAGKFLGYDEFYLKRGTSTDFSWKKGGNGHRFAKTKYDWGKGSSSQAKTFESSKTEGFAQGFFSGLKKK